MAAKAKKTVYLLISLNVSIEEVKPGQLPLVWIANKYSILQRNSEVKKIVCVNLTTYIVNA
jgi:hypothetical protein